MTVGRLGICIRYTPLRFVMLMMLRSLFFAHFSFAVISPDHRRAGCCNSRNRPRADELPSEHGDSSFALRLFHFFPLAVSPECTRREGEITDEKKLIQEIRFCAVRPLYRATPNHSFEAISSRFKRIMYDTRQICIASNLACTHLVLSSSYLLIIMMYTLS